MSNRWFAFFTVFGFVLIVVSEPLWKKFEFFYNDMTTEQPWFSADLQISKSDTGFIYVNYNRIIKRRMISRWTRWAEYPTAGGGWQRFCSGSGRETYYPSRTGITKVSLDYFVGTKTTCGPGDKPFRVCADWRMKDFKGRVRHFGEICSTVFDPKS